MTPQERELLKQAAQKASNDNSRSAEEYVQPGMDSLQNKRDMIIKNRDARDKANEATGGVAPLSEGEVRTGQYGSGNVPAPQPDVLNSMENSVTPGSNQEKINNYFQDRNISDPETKRQMLPKLMEFLLQNGKL